MTAAPEYMIADDYTRPNCATDPRTSGQATRWATWPMHKPGTVAEHSWQVGRILLAIWPSCPREMLVHAITHDIGEVGPGDAPFPSKRDNPVFAKEHSRLEDETHLAMVLRWSVPPPPELSHMERRVFKLAEFIEMWEHSLQELFMGNQLARLPAHQCITAVRSIQAEIQPLEPLLVANSQTYINRRRTEWRLQF